MERVAVGPIGELLVVFVPEFRGTVEQLVDDETGYRARNGAGLTELTAFRLFTEFRERVLSPALAGLPETRDLVVRCGQALLAVLTLDHLSAEFHQEALALRITERLTPDEWQRLLAVVPDGAPLREL
jgi:hypothetical protein